MVDVSVSTLDRVLYTVNNMVDVSVSTLDRVLYTVNNIVCVSVSTLDRVLYNVNNIVHMSVSTLAVMRCFDHLLVTRYFCVDKVVRYSYVMTS
jgi:hypothetical protein